MSVRCLGNMMIHGYGRGIVETCIGRILPALHVTKSGSPNLQVSIRLQSLILISEFLLKY